MLRSIAFTTGLATALLAGSSIAYAAESPKDFITNAIKGDNSEVMLGQLAQQKGGNEKTKDFGKTLVADHTKAKQQAEDVAKTLGVTPPTQPMQKAKDEQSKLSNMSGSAFDNEFANYMVTDHQNDIQNFQQEANANNGAASDLAKKQLPVLQKHLRIAQSLLSTSSQNGSTTTAPASKQSTAETLKSAPTRQAADEWRASKLAGVPIYGPGDKKIGAVTDVLMSKEGKADLVVVGVGGFLGIGQKDVAIPFQKVRFSNRPLTKNTSAGGASGNGAGGSSSVNGSASTSGSAQKTSPDHGVIDMTADQLKNAPSFKFAK